MFWGKKKQKQKVFSGFPGDVSPDQIVALQNFRQYVYQNKNIDPHHYDQVYLLRFLRARKFDVTKTKLMWDNFIKWRVKNNIDNCFTFKFPELPQLRKMYPHGYHKVDKQFRPIYIERVGSIDVEKIFKVMSTEHLLNYYALLYQTLLTSIFDGCSEARLKATGINQRVAQTITILDLKHVKLGSASKAYDFVKPVSAMAQDNYPQILGNMFIINAPMLFTGIWAIVKMWIDEKTKQKIKILGSSYKKQLLELIDPQNLPDFLQGGKCKCEGGCQLDRNIGPWNPQGKQMLGFALGLQKQQLKTECKLQKKIQLKQQKQIKVQPQKQVKKEQQKPTDIQIAVGQKKQQQIEEKKQQQIEEKKQQTETNKQQQNVFMLCVNAGLAAQQKKLAQQKVQAQVEEKREESKQQEDKQLAEKVIQKQADLNVQQTKVQEPKEQLQKKEQKIEPEPSNLLVQK